MILPNYKTLKDWFERVGLYFLLFLLTMILSPIVLGIMNTNVENSRYMISALIQSEAAIVAIVITLTLIVVQQTSSAYSTRLLDIFLYKNPDFWILFLIYISSIIYGCRVLLQIDVTYNPIFKTPFLLTISNIYGPIYWTYYFAIFSLLSLIVYIFHTMNLLKPSNILEKLSEEITKDNILLAIEDKKIIEKDPIQPIIDIVWNSWMKYDIETFRNGLRTIEVRTKFILKNETFEIEEEKKISTNIIESHLTGIGKLAANRKDVVYTKEVITNLHVIGLVAVEQKLNTVMMEVAGSLKEIGIIAVKENLEDTTSEAIKSLEEIGKAALKQNLIGTVQVLDALFRIGKAAINQDLVNIAWKSANSIHIVGELIPNKSTIKEMVKKESLKLGTIDAEGVYVIIAQTEQICLSNLIDEATNKNLPELEEHISILLSSQQNNYPRTNSTGSSCT